MKKETKNIRGRDKDQYDDDPWGDFKDLASTEDKALFNKVREFVLGSMDIEEVRNDPDYRNAAEETGKLAAGFNSGAVSKKSDYLFIKSNILAAEERKRLESEVAEIREESAGNNVNSVTQEWVKNWRRREEEKDGNDGGRLERMNFIAKSLGDPEKEPAGSEQIPEPDKTPVRRKFRIWYSLPAAAAVMGAFLLLRILYPSDDTNRIYNSFFVAPVAVSDITRGDDPVVSDIYSTAVTDFNNKRYREASLGFSETFNADDRNISSLFYLGVTHMIMGRWDEAVNEMETVLKDHGEFLKEARWYLGLASLRTGDKGKAMECFKVLAQTPGYYHDRAEKILRRLR